MVFLYNLNCTGKEFIVQEKKEVSIKSTQELMGKNLTSVIVVGGKCIIEDKFLSSVRPFELLIAKKNQTFFVTSNGDKKRLTSKTPVEETSLCTLTSIECHLNNEQIRGYRIKNSDTYVCVVVDTCVAREFLERGLAGTLKRNISSLSLMGFLNEAVGMSLYVLDLDGTVEDILTVRRESQLNSNEDEDGEDIQEDVVARSGDKGDESEHPLSPVIATALVSEPGSTDSPSDNVVITTDNSPEPNPRSISSTEREDSRPSRQKINRRRRRKNNVVESSESESEDERRNLARSHPYDRQDTQYCFALTALQALSVCPSFNKNRSLSRSNQPLSNLLEGVRRSLSSRKTAIIPLLKAWDDSRTPSGEFDGTIAKPIQEFIRALLADIQAHFHDLHYELRTTLLGEALCDECRRDIYHPNVFIHVELDWTIETIANGIEAMCTTRIPCTNVGCGGTGPARWNSDFGNLIIVTQGVSSEYKVSTVSYDIPLYTLFAVCILLGNDDEFIAGEDLGHILTGHYVVAIRQPAETWLWYDGTKEPLAVKSWRENCSIMAGRNILQRTLFYQRSSNNATSIFTDSALHTRVVPIHDPYAAASSNTTVVNSRSDHFAAYIKVGNGIYECRACKSVYTQSQNVTRHFLRCIKNQCEIHCRSYNSNT